MRNVLLLTLLMLLSAGVGILMNDVVGADPALSTAVGIPVGFLIGYFGMSLFARIGWVAR